MRRDRQATCGGRRGDRGAVRAGSRRRRRPQDFFSALFGAFGVGRAAALPFVAAAVCERGRLLGRRAEPRVRDVGYRRRPGLLRAHLRRPLFPDHGGRRPEPRGVVQQLLPGQRDQGGLRQQYRSMPRPKAASPIPSCRTRFAIATRLVAGCTCNGKDQIGLAPVKIEDDPTLRKGDIVAGARRPDGRRPQRRQARRSLNFSPASAAVRAQYQRVPVVAAE